MVQAQGIQQGENQKVLIRYLDKSSVEVRDLKSQVADLTEILAKFLSSNSKMDARTQDGKSDIFNGLCALYLTYPQQ
jgi:hypothetical protein